MSVFDQFPINDAPVHSQIICRHIRLGSYFHIQDRVFHLIKFVNLAKVYSWAKSVSNFANHGHRVGLLSTRAC